MPVIFKTVFTFFILGLITSNTFSQELITSDELLKASQTAIRQEKNYPKAISLLKRALVLSPDYADVRIMLGRVYTWNSFPDSARIQFSQVLKKDPKNEEAFNASFDLEYWNDNPGRALEIANEALVLYPASQELAVKRAKALNSLKQPALAIRLTEQFVKQHPGSKNAEVILQALKVASMKNDITFGYTFSSFDKRFENPWQMANISYGRVTPIATVNFQVNYANRFKTNGIEFETTSYPSIVKGLYAYVGAAFSNSSIFSRHRFGLSLYKTLPKSFEVEGGIRYLKFDSSTLLYVVGIGRYFGNNFVGLRSYIGPGEEQYSKSFNLYTRFYLSDDRNDYFGISGGTGFSPDDRSQNLVVNSNLKSYKAGLEYSRNINRHIAISASGSFVNEEFRTATFGNQFTVSAGIKNRF